MTRSYPTFPEFFLDIGYFAQPHGLKGEINLVSIRDFQPESGTVIFVDIDSTWIPLQIATARRRSDDQFLIQLVGYTSEDAVSQFKGHNVAIGCDRDCLEHLDDDEFYIDDLDGFDVRLDSGEDYGVIIGIEQSTENNLMIVRRLDESVTYIPFVDEFITAINPGDKSITIDLPIGFDDIF